ncbi:hypothetical protein BD413DRAFT_615491 [Trametes elegans]|nr:hypothetical protein BD413DRAFT_615491 [Trametes elegans]
MLSLPNSFRAMTVSPIPTFEDEDKMDTHTEELDAAAGVEALLHAVFSESYSDVVSFSVFHGELSPEMLAILARFPSLQELSVTADIWNADESIFPYVYAGVGLFPALRQVRITTNCFPWAASLIGVMSSTTLTRIRIETPVCPANASAIAAVLRAVARSPSATAISELRISSGRSDSLLLPIPIVTSDMLLPLAALRALQTFQLRGWVVTRLHDGGAGVLSRAWPHIRHLSLPTPPSHWGGALQFRAPSPHLTLVGLTSFAQHCAHLVDLELSFDARLAPGVAVPAQAPYASMKRPVAPVAFLDVGESPIKDAEAAASYLSFVLPHLQIVQNSYSCVHGREHKWDAFERAYEGFVKARKEHAGELQEEEVSDAS